MNMTGVYKIKTHDQLKAIADPLRTKILMKLVKEAYTGQQLAEMLGIQRNNIYFHLKELEKHGIIQVVRKEEKNGIVQKYYRAVAGRFIPEDHLLPSADLVETSRQVFMETLEATRTKIENAPAESFALDSRNETRRKNIASTYRFHATEESFHAFVEEFRQLMNKHFTIQTSETADSQESVEEKGYYLSLIAFQDDDENITN
ncbi:ArsR/SmtB family transcription factor [Paenibacillus azoreducens]|uniref:Transcriptional regulator n=1 Tax=Paenibacillus azoreducens TaxID=116718 RepID=A0A919YB00_9BACL|nr:transcriptional regulator [Paenibacillus azoreducens]